MSTIDFITILGNISQSLAPVQRLITGLSYLLGLLFFVTAITKFRHIGDRNSQEKMMTPVLYLFFGGALLYLPTTMSVLANTAFGAGNVLTYGNYNKADIYSAMGMFIRTAGVIWFLRGCVLVTQASEPGAQDGPKGLVFIISGIFAMNFDNTIAMINYILNHLIAWSLQVKASQGY